MRNLTPIRTGNIMGFQGVQPHPRIIPSRSIHWPDKQDVNNQIQQIKGSVQASHANVNQVVLNPSSPQPVSNLRITRMAMDATSHQLTVRFNPNTQDNYFQGVNVYLRTGNAPPVLVGAGTHSPINLTVAKTSVPSTVFVQSAGNWGNTPLGTSPAKAVNLR